VENLSSGEKSKRIYKLQFSGVKIDMEYSNSVSGLQLMD
jgi:hypothetical protein